MAILRCPHCQFLKEVANAHLGKTVSCPACGKEAKVVDTVKLVDTAVKRFLEVSQQYKVLKQTYEDSQQKVKQLTDEIAVVTQEKTTLQAQLDKNKAAKAHNPPQTPPTNTLFNSFNQANAPAQKEKSKKNDYLFKNKDYAAELNNFQPIIEWFKNRHIEIQPNVQASDISGYFDEIAVMIGDNLDTLEKLLDGIRYRQRKKFQNFSFDLKNYDQKQATFLKKFCKTAYEAAFFSRYRFLKDKNNIFLILNESPQIENFFNGDWLEWYGFMKVSSFLQAQQYSFACLRSSHIQWTNQRNEIDIFFLINGTEPLWIECKSGEFRDSINKYQELRKRLNIHPDYSILLVSGLEDEKSKALSSMFKLQIVNEKTLLPYLANLLKIQ